MHDFTQLPEDSAEVHQKYAGMWIAVAGGYVIAVGETATIAAAQAETTCPGRPFVLDIAGPLVDLPSVFDD